jgi:peroxiredoxin
MSLHHWLTAALVLGSTTALAAPKIGETAPDFRVVDTAGTAHQLSDFRGKTVVLEWTNHDCPFVKKHYNGSDNMQGLQRAAAEQEVVWLSVISSAPGKQGHVSPAEADALTASRKAAPAAVLLDASGDMGRAYEAKTTPHMYVINTEGVLTYNGAIDSIPSADPADIAKAEPWLQLAQAATLAGDTPSPALTKPYGCSIKY